MKYKKKSIGVTTKIKDKRVEIQSIRGQKLNLASTGVAKLEIRPF